MELRILGSFSIFPRILHAVASLHSLPSEIGVGPKGKAKELPSTQKQIAPGSTTCFASFSRGTDTGTEK